MPKKNQDNVAFPSISRRQFIATFSFGAGIFVIGRYVRNRPMRNKVLRPPGAIREENFIALCARCGKCVSVCPNSALQLQGFENGIENLFTPKLTPNRGYCIMPVNGCQKCIDSCPVKVLQPIDLESSSSQLSNVLKIGEAFIDESICIPYALRQPCLACKEICPVNEAITLERGSGPAKPIVNHDLCVGCGACEYACPTTPKAVAISGKHAKRFEWKF